MSPLPPALFVLVLALLFCRYDTVHGVYGGDVSHDGEHLIVDGTKIKVRHTDHYDMIYAL